MKVLASGLVVVVLAGSAARAEEPQRRTIDDYTVKLLGMQLPAKWFYRNVGVGRPAGPGQQAGAAADERTMVRVYVVRDLVVADEGQADFAPLVKLLTSTVAPDTWKEGDGDDGRVGMMAPVPEANGLLVRNTREVHDQVIERLRQLRELPPLQGRLIGIEVPQAAP